MNFIIKFWIDALLQMVSPRFLGLGGGQFEGQAKDLYGQAQQATGQFGGQAATEGAMLNPFFAQEMRARHSMSPDQANQMLTAAEAGAGGAFGGAEGQMKAEAARTGNATTLTKSLDEMARDRAKAGAGAAEGIAAQDVAGAQQLHQQGAAGLQGLYGTNVGGQLAAMKQSAADVQLENEMKPQDWVSQLNQLKQGVGDVASMAGAFA